MRVTLTARLRSGILLEAARKCGSNRALAKRLKVQESKLGEWINLKSVPSAKTIETRWVEWEIALYEILGRAVEIDSVFPPELRESLATEPVTVFESTVDIAAQQIAVAPSAPMLLDSEELKYQVSLALGILGLNEREVLEKRFGLDGADPMTLDEIATLKGLSKERIRAIEAQALTRLRKASHLSRPSYAGASPQRRAAIDAVVYLRPGRKE